MNAASPGVISAFLPNKFYKNDDEYLENLSNIMKDEYEEITSNGLKLQLDCPDLALARHMTCLLYTSPSPRDVEESRMPSSA